MLSVRTQLECHAVELWEGVQPKIGDALEAAPVEGEQSEVVVECRCGDHKIKVVDQVTPSAKVNTQRCKLPRNVVVGAQNRISMRELLDARKVSVRIVRTVRPLIQFRDGYPTDGYLSSRQLLELVQQVDVSTNGRDRPTGVEQICQLWAVVRA